MDARAGWDPRPFWDVVASSGRSLRALGRRLEALSRLDLCRYRLAFERLKDEVNPHSREECWPYLVEECSEDGADDFAAWVVLQGPAFHAEVARHPERIQAYLEMFDDCEAGRAHAELRWDEEVDRDEYRGYQRADYLAAAVYRSRFGGDLLDACYDERGRPREGLE